jgi:hypothetical protein
MTAFAFLLTLVADFTALPAALWIASGAIARRVRPARLDERGATPRE